MSITSAAMKPLKQEAAQYQTCIASAVTFEGVGTHSGTGVTMTVLPAASGTGLVFERTDLDADNQIPALWSNISNTMMCTTITNEAGVSVSTIEHIMAALYACEIDNARIQVSGPEVPIMDGSSDLFIHDLLAAGNQTLDAPRRTLKILKTIIVRESADRWVSVSPGEQLSFDCEFHFGDRADFPLQRFKSEMTPEIFRTELSKARTFGFVEDVMKLRSMGLAQGSSLENAVGIQDGKVMNPEGLRFKDEFVRHKILDAIGDMYTAGATMQATIKGSRTGHGLMHQLLCAIFADQRNWELV